MVICNSVTVNLEANINMGSLPIDYDGFKYIVMQHEIGRAA
jgi:hypothetical protein